MKNQLFLFAILLCGCFALTSCEKTTPIDEPTPTDKPGPSLAGMIISQYIMKAEGTYDSKPLRFPVTDILYSKLSTSKISHTEQKFDFRMSWDGLPIDVKIPVVPLIGEPFVEIWFHNTCTDATVVFDETEYTNVRTKIKGWIKKGSEVSSTWLKYTCDIEVECDLNGKVLWFKITDLRPV